VSGMATTQVDRTLGTDAVLEEKPDSLRIGQDNTSHITVLTFCCSICENPNDPRVSEARTADTWK
jgi:hypothetical protein